MKIVLRGPFNTKTGYGSDLVGLTIALARQGHKVYPLPTSISPPIPRDVAILLAQDYSGPFDLGVCHQPPFDLIAPTGMKQMCTKMVGWTMWEQTHFLREHWNDVLDDPNVGDYPWREFDSIFAYDPTSRDALAAYDPEAKYHVLQGGVEEARWPYMDDRKWSGTFRFVMVGELAGRKDPWVAIEAFRELQEEGRIEDAELHLKTSVPGLHPDIGKTIPNVHVHASWWTREQLLDFYRKAHVLLSPSRGEGKNLPAIEMQLTGGVVIATNWGGHLNWLHPEYAFPLDYTLMEIGDSGSSNARADKEHLKQLMVKTYENRDQCQRMGRTASSQLRSMCSWDEVAKRFVRMAMED